LWLRFFSSWLTFPSPPQKPFPPPFRSLSGSAAQMFLLPARSFCPCFPSTSVGCLDLAQSPMVFDATTRGRRVFGPLFVRFFVREIPFIAHRMEYVKLYGFFVFLFFPVLLVPLEKRYQLGFFARTIRVPPPILYATFF